MMRYQDNQLAQQHDELNEKYLKCKKYMEPMSLPDIDYTNNVKNELSLFEERFLGEPMVFENEKDEFSILQIIRRVFKNQNKPAFFHFDNGAFRRPVLNDEERNLVDRLLTPRRDDFKGRVSVYNWSSDGPNTKVKVLFEKTV